MDRIGDVEELKAVWGDVEPYLPTIVRPIPNPQMPLPEAVLIVHLNTGEDHAEPAAYLDAYGQLWRIQSYPETGNLFGIPISPDEALSIFNLDMNGLESLIRNAVIRLAHATYESARDCLLHLAPDKLKSSQLAF